MYSGGNTTATVEAYAANSAEAYNTIGQTDVGKFLGSPEVNDGLRSAYGVAAGADIYGTPLGDRIGGPTNESLWGQASERFASTASGDVIAIVGDANSGRIFSDVELLGLSAMTAMAKLHQ